MDVELGSMGRRPRTGSLDQTRPAPEGANAPIKIVVAVDASSGAQTAFVRAVELLEKNRNPNSMLYVLATRALPARWGTVLLQEDSTQSEQERREEDKIRQLLAVYEDQLKNFKVVAAPFNPSSAQTFLLHSHSHSLVPLQRMPRARPDLGHWM